MKISTKLKTINILTIVFIIVVGIVGFNYMNKMSNQTNDMYHEQLLPIYWMNDIRAHSRANESNVNALMLTKDTNARTQLIEDINRRALEVEEKVNLYKQTDLTSFEEEQLQIIETEVVEIGNHREQIYKLLDAGENEQAFNYYLTNIAPSLTILNNSA